MAPRIPYLPKNISTPSEIVDPIRRRRGGELNEVDRLLLFAPPVAQGWNALAGAIRGEITLPAKLRELAICGVGLLNRSDFEYRVHAPAFVKAGGTQLQVDALASFEKAGERADLFNEVERAVIELTIAMTKNVEVSDATFDRVKTAIGDDRQVVELVATIAMYNMASRFIVALRIE